MSTDLATKTEQPKRSIVARMDGELTRSLDAIDAVLPPYLSGQAGRLIKRALVTFSKDPDLQRCTAKSFVRAVLSAAELGLAIDGRLCHAVKYGNEAVAMPDYKGLIAIARRSGCIAGIRADVVCEHDHFDHGRSGPASRLEHTYAHGGKRGKVQAAYAILRFPDGTWDYELMQLDDIEQVRRSSKANRSDSPWRAHFNEMAKKTVIRRALKHFSDDERLGAAFELSDQDYPQNIPSSRAIATGKLNDVRETVLVDAEPITPDSPASDAEMSPEDFEAAVMAIQTAANEVAAQAFLKSFEPLASDEQFAELVDHVNALECGE